jgi:hypothetical protein
MIASDGLTPGLIGRGSDLRRRQGCERRAGGTRVGFMTYERQWLVDLLHRLGYAQAANDAMRLPDHISEEQLQEFGNRHGISRGELMNEMGGSP